MIEGHETICDALFTTILFLFFSNSLWWGIILVPHEDSLSEVRKKLPCMWLKLSWTKKNRSLTLIFWMFHTRISETFNEHWGTTMQQLRSVKSNYRKYSRLEWEPCDDDCEDGSSFYVAGMLRRIFRCSIRFIKEN